MYINCCDYQDQDFGYADMGGAYVGYQQTKVMQVLKELQLQTYSKVSDLENIVVFKVIHQPFYVHFNLCCDVLCNEILK